MRGNLTSEQCIKRQKRNEKLAWIFFILAGVAIISWIFEISFRCMPISSTDADFALLFELYFCTVSACLYFIFGFLAACCLGAAKFYKTIADLSQ